MKNKKKIVFVHGHGGVDEGSWPYWLAREAVLCGFDFVSLAMPNPMYPEVSEWVSFLKEQKIKVDKDTYFVGHSLGCITIARFLEGLSPRIVAGGCVLIAGFSSLPKIPLLSEFCFLPLDFSKVKKHAREFVCILSDNDHVISRTETEEFGKKLGARIIVEHNKGHFRHEVKELPSVLNTILEMELVKEKLKR
jgi:uncharacterized protein